MADNKKANPLNPAVVAGAAAVGVAVGAAGVIAAQKALENENVQGVISDVKQSIGDAVDKVGETVQDVKTQAQNTGENVAESVDHVKNTIKK